MYYVRTYPLITAWSQYDVDRLVSEEEEKKMQAEYFPFNILCAGCWRWNTKHKNKNQNNKRLMILCFFPVGDCGQ